MKEKISQEENDGWCILAELQTKDYPSSKCHHFPSHFNEIIITI